MVAPVVNFVGSNLSLAESVTNWAAFKIDGTGGGPSAALEPDVFIQGSNSISTICNKQRVWLYYDIATASAALDFDAGGANFGQHIFMWVNFSTPGFAGTESGVNACAVALGTDTTNYSYWNIFGNDSGYAGGWLRIVLDPLKTPTANVGSGVATGAINFVGFIGDVQGNTAKFTNLFMDRLDVGFGLQVEEGDDASPVTWQAIFDDDDATANKYGVVQKEGSIFILNGGLEIGQKFAAGSPSIAGTRPTKFSDPSGAIVNFANPTYHDGTSRVTSINNEDLYRILIQGNEAGGSPSGQTEFTLGSVVGSGADRQGILGGAITTAGPKFTIDARTGVDAGDVSIVNIYGVQISGAGICEFAGATETDIIGSSFIGCDEVRPNDAEWLNNFIIAPNDLGVEMLLTHNIQGTSFIAGSGGNVERHVHHPVQGSPSTQTYSYVGMEFFGFGAVGSPDPKWHGLWDGDALLQINATDPSNPNENEFDIFDPLGSVNVTNTVTLTVTVVDAAGDPIENARVAIYDTKGTTATPDDEELMNELTNASGVATASFNYLSDTPIYIRVRKSSTGSTRYVDNGSTGTILSTGFSSTVTLRVDGIATS